MQLRLERTAIILASAGDGKARMCIYDAVRLQSSYRLATTRRLLRSGACVKGAMRYFLL